MYDTVNTTLGKRARWIIALSLLAMLVTLRGLTFLADTGAIGAGYTAKQVCSGVFVARLPERFVLETDVLPRLSTVGPVSELLDYEIHTDEKTVSATLLGQEMLAAHHPRYGCTLLPDLKKSNGALWDLSPLSIESRVHSSRTDFFRHEMPSTNDALTVESESLNRAVATAFVETATGDRNTLAVVILHRGKIVAERYNAPITARTPMQGWSMNKSLMATFIARQIDQDRLHLDDLVSTALEAAGVKLDSVHSLDESLTLRHLLSMTSGFDFSERYFPGDDVTNMLYRQHAMWRSAPATRQMHEPGKQFAYSSGDINTASLMWQQSLGGEPYPDWIATHFNVPLGLQEMVLEPDASGVQVGSSYAYLTARDWARIGQLWLDAWHGRSQLISQTWQRQAVTPGTANNGGIYGLGFWLNTGQRRFPSAPESTFNAGGNSGQFVVVMPEQELVVVRLGLTLDESQADMDQLLADLLAFIH
ncbi:MAG: serine hydrolase [Luminiphilus sp.]|nr:serine hydrolase [Luminiphilus sp.]